MFRIVVASCSLAVSGRLVAASLAIAIAGCSPQGTGTIKIADPDAVRARAGGGDAKAPPTAKAARTQGLIEEAVKKNPKLQ